MDGLMMQFPLTIPAILRHAERLHGGKEIVSRRADRSIHRYTYAECIARARKLAAGLRRLGIAPGDRVATLCWNHQRHLEAYYGVPMMGAVLHTLNLRLHPDELAFIASHAGDTAVIVDESLLPLLNKFRDRTAIRHVIVVDSAERGRPGPGEPEGALDWALLYEDVIAMGEGGEASLGLAEVDENAAAVMCYTSGTTGRSKGVVYSHRALVLHSLATALPDVMSVGEADRVLAVVPMFHANAWGTPFTCALTGAAQVFPGPHLDPASILELLHNERVTLTLGVPTIWGGIVQYLDAHPGAYDLSSVRMVLIGGAAVPESLIRALESRHGLHVVQGWGMTEMSPVGTVSTLTAELRDAPDDVRVRYRATAGRALPFVELRVRGEDGIAPWDGESMGELEVRGPWIARGYYEHPESRDRFTDDGWFRTGDIVSIDARGYMTIRDRSKDLVKSGGEWISSVALENALMGHPDVAEAAVIAVPHPRWDERPLACVVPKPGCAPSTASLASHLAQSFPKWWLPDDYVVIDAIPRTSVGKFLKSALRDRFRGYYTSRPAAPAAETVESPLAT